MNINRHIALTLLAAGLLLTGAVAIGAERTPATQPTSYSFKDRYTILSQRNIFLKDRSRPSSGSGTGSGVREAPRPVEASFILTGVVLEEGDLRAYMEDNANSKILRLVVGDTVARGRITQIEIDGIEYEADGQRSWIQIGRTLTGQAFVPPVAATPTTNPSSGATGPGTATASTATVTVPPLPNPNDPNLTLEQRMKMRRAMELNKK